MSSIGTAGVSVIPLAAVAAVALVPVALGVALVGAGVQGTLYCGRVLKRKLDEREQAINAADQAYYTQYLGNQAAFDQALASLAENIVVENYSESKLPLLVPAANATLEQRMVDRSRELRTKLEKIPSPEHARLFLADLRNQRSAERAKQTAARQLRQLEAKLVDAVKAGLEAEQRLEMERLLVELQTNPASQQLQAKLKRATVNLDAWFAQQSKRSSENYVRYEHQRAREELEEAVIYVTRERLGALEDIDLAGLVQTIADAQAILETTRERLDDDPAKARKEIERARQMVVTNIAESRERVEHARQDLEHERLYCQAKLKTLREMMSELIKLGLTVSVAPAVAELESETRDLGFALQFRRQPIERIRLRIQAVKSQAVEIRLALEKELARRQREGIAHIVQGVLNDLGYHSAFDRQVIAQPAGDTWRIAGYVSRRRDQQAGAVFHISQDAEGNLRIAHDFQGFDGKKDCARAKEEIFAKLRERGVEIDTNAQRETLFETYYYQDTIDKLKDVLRQMNYENIQESDMAGHVRLEAFNGPTGFTISLPQDGDIAIYKHSPKQRSKMMLGDLEHEAGLKLHIQNTLGEEQQKLQEFNPPERQAGTA